MKPVRIQLSRAKGFNLQAASRAINGLPCVKVDRTTDWGNPVSVADIKASGTFGADHVLRGIAVGYFREYCPPGSPLAEAARRILRGNNLGCWCPLPTPGEPDNCHAAVLLELSNR